MNYKYCPETPMDYAIRSRLKATSTHLYSAALTDYRTMHDLVSRDYLSWPVCDTCGGTRITCDGITEWDIDAQDWTLIDLHERTWCDGCEAECDVIWRYRRKDNH